MIPLIQPAAARHFHPAPAASEAEAADGSFATELDAQHIASNASRQDGPSQAAPIGKGGPTRRGAKRDEPDDPRQPVAQLGLPTPLARLQNQLSPSGAHATSAQSESTVEAASMTPPVGGKADQSSSGQHAGAAEHLAPQEPTAAWTVESLIEPARVETSPPISATVSAQMTLWPKSARHSPMSRTPMASPPDLLAGFIPQSSGHVLGPRSEDDPAPQPSDTDEAASEEGSTSAQTEPDRASEDLTGVFGPDAEPHKTAISDTPTARAGATTANRLPPEITAQILRNLQSAQGPLSGFVLTHGDIGKLRFQIRRHGPDLRVLLSVERADTLVLVRRDAEHLAQELRAAGFPGLSVDIGHWNGREASRTLLVGDKAEASDQTDTLPVTAMPTEPDIFLESGLDLRL